MKRSTTKKPSATKEGCNVTTQKTAEWSDVELAALESLKFRIELNSYVARLEKLAGSGDQDACALLVNHTALLVVRLNTIATAHPEWFKAAARKLPAWPVLDSPKADFQIPDTRRNKKPAGPSDRELLFDALELGADHWTDVTKKSRAKLSDELGLLIQQRLNEADYLRKQNHNYSACESICRLALARLGQSKHMPRRHDQLTDGERTQLQEANRSLAAAKDRKLLNCLSTIQRYVPKRFTPEQWLQRVAVFNATLLPPLAHDTRSQWAHCVKLLLLADYPSAEELEGAYGHLVSYSNYKAGRLMEDIEERLNNWPMGSSGSKKIP